MTINKLLLTGAISSIMMTSCSSFNPEKTAKVWDAIQIGSQQVTPGPNSPYLGFDNGSIYGFTGCNRINGGIEINGSEFIAGNVTTTMKLCPDAKFEQSFLSVLNEAKEIKACEAGFDLLDQNGKSIATFSPHLLNVKDLEGEWKLINLNGEEIAQNEETPFLIFDIKEKRMGGFTGCNRISTDLNLKELADCNIDFSKMAMTRKMCTNHKFEADFVDAMNHSTTIVVKENKLYLYTEDDVNSLVFSKE